MASASVLQPVKERGWRQGFTNFLRKENGEWWGTRRWWVQSLLWLLIINGILAVGIWVVPIYEPAEAAVTAENLGIFIQLMTWFPMFAVIVIIQGAVIGENNRAQLPGSCLHRSREAPSYWPSWSLMQLVSSLR